MARLIIISILFLFSLLCLFPAPTYRLWQLSILASEFPWIFIILIPFLLAWGIKVQKYQLAGTLIGIVALIIFFTPIIRAYIAAGPLNKDFDAAFSTTAPDESTPFHPLQMITGMNAPELPYEVMTYSTAGTTPLTLDYYHAQATGKRPCVIIVHGGSWAGGDSRQLPELNTVLAKAGYNVATINYRLAPQYHSPASVEDLYAAIDYLKQHSDQLSVDTGSFALLGRSAGAQIVSAAGYAKQVPGVKGVISFYGPADMIWGYQHPGNPLVLKSCEVMEAYLGGTYSQLPERYKESSPIEFVTAQTIPTLLIHGQNDPLVAYGHSTRLVAKMQQAGARYYLLTLPWATHGADYTLNGPAGQLSTYTIRRFLKYIFKS